MDFVQRIWRTCTFFFIITLLGTLFSANSMLRGEVTQAPTQFPPNCSLAFRTANSDFIPIQKSVSNAIQNNYDLLENLNKTLFNTAILRRPENARIILENLPRHLGSGAYGTIPLIGAPGKSIPYTFFDRGSDELIIIGGGFANPREMLAPLLGIFVDYNVVIFDHVGHGLDYKPASILGAFFKATLNIDFTALKGGAQEENEILSIAQHFKRKTNYKTLYGVGFCYSTGLFLRTAAHHPGLFKKLILDGAWESAEALMKRFADKPALFFDPQRGNPSEQKMRLITRSIYNFYMFITTLQMVQRHIRGTAANLVSNGPSLEKLSKTPILFVHGTNDLVISAKQFHTTWEKKAGEKMAILTDSRHLQNHIKYKQLFSWSANCFLDLGLDALEYSLASPEALATTYETLRQCKEAKALKLQQ